jgi:hypothetical protein
MLEKCQNPGQNPPRTLKYSSKMSDAPTLPLALAESPLPRRRGRPPGARNKRSVDLAKYIEAQYGSTPGQQMAELAMVRPADVKRAKAEAMALGIDPAGLAPLELAHLVKAKRLAKALGVTTAEAWAAGHKARVDLLPYVHQRQAQASEDKTKAPATVFLVPEADARAAEQLPDMSIDDDGAGFELIEDFGEVGHQVGNPKSDDAA